MRAKCIINYYCIWKYLYNYNIYIYIYCKWCKINFVLDLVVFNKTIVENTLIRNQQKAQQMYVKWDTKSKHMPLVLESSIISLPLRHRQRRWSLRLYLVNKLPTLAASLTGFSHKVEGTLLTIFLRCQLPEQVYRSKSWKTFRFWVCNDKEWQAIR